MHSRYVSLQTSVLFAEKMYIHTEIWGWAEICPKVLEAPEISCTQEKRLQMKVLVINNSSTNIWPNSDCVSQALSHQKHTTSPSAPSFLDSAFRVAGSYTVAAYRWGFFLPCTKMIAMIVSTSCHAENDTIFLVHYIHHVPPISTHTWESLVWQKDTIWTKLLRASSLE